MTARQDRTGFRVTVLGASGTYPAPGHACSGYLVSTDSTHVWVDCGSGTLANLQRHIDLADLDAVVCTHEHPDHWIDLTIATNAMRYGVDRPDDEIPLFWTAGVARMFETVSGRPIEPTFAATVIDDSVRATVGDIELSFSRTDHPVETYAVRAASAGRSLVYSADTGTGWSVAALGPDRGDTVDVALIEATMDEDYDGDFQHLRASDAAAMAAAADVGHLILTHLAPGADAAQRRVAAAAHFPGPIDVAEENTTYPI